MADTVDAKATLRLEQLVLGTHNAKKCRELQILLAPYGFEVRSLADIPDSLAVVEDGTSFAENAAKKAAQQAQHLDAWVLGEDSGLVVDALGGAPGIHSARYAGEPSEDREINDQANNDRLLRELADVPPAKRTAHYICHAALSDPAGEIRIRCEARCAGRIRIEPAGQGGFGYDPLFEVVEYHQSFAELGDAVKSVLSHRARAMRRLIPALVRLRTD